MHGWNYWKRLFMRIDLLPKLQWDFINRKKVTSVEFFLERMPLEIGRVNHIMWNQYKWLWVKMTWIFMFWKQFQNYKLDLAFKPWRMRWTLKWHHLWFVWQMTWQARKGRIFKYSFPKCHDLFVTIYEDLKKVI